MPHHHNPYAQFQGRQLSLSDHLAIDRTVLANERTILAYGRTALAMLIIGGSAIKFFSPLIGILLGIPFIGGGAVVMLWGWMRYQRTRRYLAIALEQRTGSPDHPLEDAADRSNDKSSPPIPHDGDAHTYHRNLDQ
jgi:putative membrane protein